MPGSFSISVSITSFAFVWILPIQVARSETLSPHAFNIHSLFHARLRQWTLGSKASFDLMGTARMAFKRLLKKWLLDTTKSMRDQWMNLIITALVIVIKPTNVIFNISIVYKTELSSSYYLQGITCWLHWIRRTCIWFCLSVNIADDNHGHLVWKFPS